MKWTVELTLEEVRDLTLADLARALDAELAPLLARIERLEKESADEPA